MRPELLAGMSYVAWSAIEWSSEMLPFLKLQYTSASEYLPFVRFRNTNVMTFVAAGMGPVSQKPAGAPPSSLSLGMMYDPASDPDEVDASETGDAASFVG